MTRKDKIEKVLRRAEKHDSIGSAEAWRRLCRELENMTHPEARTPKFKDLLRCLWKAAI